MIQPQVFSFLTALKVNNNRDWFEKNRNKYEAALKSVTDHVEKLIVILSEEDEALKGITLKDCMFRIYRDVRFSHNKTPYKSHFSAAFAAGGKSSPLPGFYMHIEPGACFFAGGVWHPEAEQLAAIRQEIVYNEDEFRRIIKEKDFVKYFKKLDEEDVLKKNPKGFEKDHPAIDLLKYKSYTVTHEFQDEKALDKNFAAYAVKVFRAMKPLNAFLKRSTD